MKVALQYVATLVPLNGVGLQWRWFTLLYKFYLSSLCLSLPFFQSCEFYVYNALSGYLHCRKMYFLDHFIKDQTL